MNNGDMSSNRRIGTVKHGTGFLVMAYILLCSSLIIVVFPLLTMIMSSLKETRQIFKQPFALPVPPQWQNYAMAWERASFSIYMRNSFIVTAASIILILLLSVMAAYPLSRYAFRGRRLLTFVFLVGLMLPMRLGIVKLYLLMRDLDLIDKLWSLIFTYVAMRIPFSIFILTGFMQTIPDSYEEAARIDGCTEFQLLWKVIVPLVKPAIGIVTVFSAIAIWNDFFFPFVFIYDDALKTLPVGLGTFFGQFQVNWGLLFAGLTIASVPMLFLYALAAKDFVKGLAVGGLK